MQENTPSLEFPSDKSKKKRGRVPFAKVAIFAVILSLVAGLVATGYLYYKTKEELKRLSSVQGQEQLAKKEVDEVVGRLGKLTLLPTEEPTIATILDEQYLATQSAFYKDAQKGDKIVVYRTAQRAFIYSPTRDIIVNSGPLILDQQGANQNAPAVKVEIRNGSSTVGAANKLSTQLKGEGFEIAAVNTASKQDYPKSVVFSNNKNISPEGLTEFAKKISAEVTNVLPDGEAATTADVLIIVGNQ